MRHAATINDRIKSDIERVHGLSIVVHHTGDGADIAMTVRLGEAGGTMQQVLECLAATQVTVENVVRDSLRVVQDLARTKDPRAPSDAARKLFEAFLEIYREHKGKPNV